MIIGDKYVYLHLPKCAGNFTKDFLLSSDPSAKEYKRAHSSISEIDKQILDGREVFMSTRNPWDWYVSWYEYSRAYKTQWWNTFSENTDGSFEQVLKNILYLRDDNEFQKKRYVTSHAWETPTPVFRHMSQLRCGWYTFRFLQIILNDYQKTFSQDRKQYNVLELLKEESTAIHFHRVENLVPDLLNFSKEHNLEIPVHTRALLDRKVNKSVRSVYSDYYSEETRKLVEVTDSLFLDFFGYTYE